MSQVLTQLKQAYPSAQCSLKYATPYQLLVATILSAQCTDARVNQVTPTLFQSFPDAHSMAAGDLGQIENLIRSTGFYRNKARSILEASQHLVRLYGGQVPAKLEDLVELPGVGRKTANVVLGVAFGIPGLVVDTHVKRLAMRMGFTKNTDPEKIEQDLMKVVPQLDWTIYAHLMIDHGRKICTARKAHCKLCPIALECPKIGL